MAKYVIMENVKGSLALPNNEFDPAHREAVHRSIIYMRKNFSHSIHLNDLAEISGFSPYHFNRLFRKITGIPPRQFLSALRLEEGKQLLLTTDASITDITMEVGYNSFGTFSARFARSVGMSPFIFRKMNTPALEAVHRFPNLAKTDFSGEHSLVSGKVERPESFNGIIFVGLFPKPIPNCRPAGGVVIRDSHTYQIGAVPDGVYYVMAAAFSWSDDSQTFLLPKDSLRGAASDPLVIHHGQVQGFADLTLRPPDFTDPPILISLPMLLVETMNRAN